MTQTSDRTRPRRDTGRLLVPDAAITQPGHARRSPVADLLRAVGALIALLVPLAGLPIVILDLAGITGITGLPSLDTSSLTWTNLTSRSAGTDATGQIFVAACLLAAALLWLSFAATTVAETAATLRRRGAPHLPLGLSATHILVAPLIATVLVGLLHGTSAKAIAPASASAAWAPGTSPTVSAPAVPDTPPFTQIPKPGVGRTCTVQRGDTLWQLAEQHLGDPLRWKEIAALNIGRLQADGQKMTNANLIEPGWVLHLPARAPHAEDPAHPAVSVSGTTAAPTPPVPAPTQPAPTQAAPAQPTTAPTVVSTAPSEAATRDSRPPAPAGIVRPASPSAGEDRTRGHQGSEDEEKRLAVGGALLAGLTLVALGCLRRRQFRRRRPGHVIARTPAALIPVERTARTAGAVAAPDVTWLDHAVRGLAQSVANAPGSRLPEVIAACLTGEALHLILAEPTAETVGEWVANPAGSRWTLRRSSSTGYSAEGRGFHYAPYPALASIGYTDEGEHWLLDLERAGIVTISGDPTRSMDLARYIGAELAHNTWSEMLTITIAGIGTELVGINPDRVSPSGDAASTLAELATRADLSSGDPELGQIDVLAGRAQVDGGDTWAHTALITQHSAAIQAPLSRFAHTVSGRRTTTSIVIVGAEPTASKGVALNVDSDGVLTVPALGLHVMAQRLTPSEAEGIGELLRHAETAPDEAAAVSSSSSSEVATHDVLGAPLPPDSAATRGSRTPQEDASGDGVVVDLRPAEQGSTPGGAAHERPVDLAETEPAVPDELDQDLADWYDPDCTRPKISLLGPITVRAQGSLPERSPRPAFYSEVVTYLVLHPRGVTAGRFGTDMWPDEPDIAGMTKVRQAISVVRKWLGTDPNTHGDYLPKSYGQSSTYRVESALVDADLFRRLRVRASSTGRIAEDLGMALRLVSGEPFEGQRPGGYGWLAALPKDLEFSALVLDTAHELAAFHLAAGEPQLAAAAAQVAILAGSREDTPLLDLVAACDAQGQREEAMAYIRQVLANHDAEVEEDLPSSTADALFQRAQARSGQ